MEDKRFAHIGKDPKFRRVPRKERKVTVDNRFNAMFQDDRFKLKYSVDKRGRPVNFTSKEQLEKFYDIESEGDDEREDDEGPSVGKHEARSTVRGFTVTRMGEKEESDLEVSDTEVPTDIKTKLQDLSVDYARGEAHLLSSSSDESSDGEEEDDEIVHDWGELDKDAERTETASRRLAVCHMDWDRIRAVDLFMVLNSFAPQGGSVTKVTIYPSEFGLQRLKEEETAGPKELVEAPSTSGDFSDGEDPRSADGETYHLEKLRKYQLNRLKYYYAVAECDSVETASKIYDECDGQEFESSAARLDLRFVPDDMTFDQKPHDVCDTLPDVSHYEPRLFMTSALQQAQVHLTWDETDPNRQIAMQKLFQNKKGKGAVELNEEQIKAFIATSSEEEDEDEEAEEEKDAGSVSGDESCAGEKGRIAKYRSLLADLAKNEEAEKKKKKSDVELEISWGVGLQEKAQQLVEKKMAEKSAETTWEQQLAKRREKRKALKKSKKQAEVVDNSDDSDDDVPSDVDMDDPYFREELEKEEFQKAPPRKDKLKKEAQVDDGTTAEDAAQLELLVMDESAEQRHFSLKSIMKEQSSKASKKGKQQKEEKADQFTVKVEDPRFAALFTSHHYNIDPSDPNFKKTPGMEAIFQEKLKRRNVTIDPEEPQEKKRPAEKDPELSRLVRLVKVKTSMNRK